MFTKKNLLGRFSVEAVVETMMSRHPLKSKTGLSMAGIWLTVLFIILTSPLPSPGENYSKKQSALVPSEWAPSLEEVQTYIEEEFAAKSQKSQRFLNQTSQSMADLRDAQLFIVYVLLIQTLDAKERTNLFNEQKHWLEKREKLSRAEVESKGGSLEPLEYSGAFRRITEERLAALEKRLKQKRTTTANHQEKKEE